MYTQKIDILRVRVAPDSNEDTSVLFLVVVRFETASRSKALYFRSNLH